LLEGTGLSVVGVEPFTDEGYSQPCELADAMLYLATLAPRGGEVQPATRGGW
jgi:hypothetical protein